MLRFREPTHGGLVSLTDLEEIPPTRHVYLSAYLRNHGQGFIRVRALLRIGAESCHNVVVGLTGQNAGIGVRSSRL